MLRLLERRFLFSTASLIEKAKGTWPNLAQSAGELSQFMLFLLEIRREYTHSQLDFKEGKDLKETAEYGGQIKLVTSN